ncbi:MAG: NTP transferase domain-containing protein [Chthoniobacterales bacterium]
MPAPTLLVLAAGLGSRYGGLKQLDPVGPGGETLLDYSVYDALRAGFDRVVFLIRRDIEKDFRAMIGARYEGRIDVGYAFQELDDLPAGFAPPAGRAKPWGTAHAVWCTRDTIAAPFAAINADDFYGADSFRQLGGFLSSVDPAACPAHFAMAGYRLDKTLSEHGTVARGICQVAPEGLLRGVEELTDLARRSDGAIASGDRTFAPDTPVSMNFWGFTPQIFPLLENVLRTFLAENAASEKAECYIPSAVADLIADGAATVRVLPTNAEWFGVTYREDRPRVVESIAKLVAAGTYNG